MRRRPTRIPSTSSTDRRCRKGAARPARRLEHRQDAGPVECFEDASFGVSQLGFVIEADAVDLPQIEVVGLEPTQRFLKHLQGQIGAAAMGLLFLYSGLRISFDRTRQQARRVLLASVVYLPVLYGLMLFDHAA